MHFKVQNLEREPEDTKESLAKILAICYKNLLISSKSLLNASINT